MNYKIQKINKIKHKNLILTDEKLEPNNKQNYIDKKGKKNSAFDLKKLTKDENISNSEFCHPLRKLKTSADIRFNKLRDSFDRDRKIDEEPEFESSEQGSYMESYRKLSSGLFCKKASYLNDLYDLRVNIF